MCVNSFSLGRQHDSIVQYGVESSAETQRLVNPLDLRQYSCHYSIAGSLFGVERLTVVSMDRSDAGNTILLFVV